MSHKLNSGIAVIGIDLDMKTGVAANEMTGSLQPRPA
jgi:hypothetical protein